METCSNCGATLRPGAKFCTTCGTRLNSAPSPNDGWGRPAAPAANDAQETSVLEAVNQPDPEQPSRLSGSNEQRDYDRWTGAYGSTPAPSHDPASRFISALTQDAKPAEADTRADEPEGANSPNPATSWVTPSPEAFQTGRPSTWNFQPASRHDDWKAPATWNTVGPAPAETEVERTNDPSVILDPILHPSGTDSDDESGQEADPAIEALPAVTESGDDNTGEAATVVDVQPAAVEETAQQDADDDDDDLAEVLAAGITGTGTFNDKSATAIAPEDARRRAISLIDDLRRMVRMMPGGNVPDMGAAAMALTEASLNVSDFADVREAITELQDDPRDIQALSNLARMADKIELLLDEHQSLVAAIETALQVMSGQQ